MCGTHHPGRKRIFRTWAVASLCYGSVPATLFQLYAAIFFYRGWNHIELSHIAGLYFFWAMFFWCISKSGALTYFIGQRVFFVEKVPYSMWLYLTCGGVMGEWWWGKLIQGTTYKGDLEDPLGVCVEQLGMGQRYSLMALCQLWMSWFWTSFYVDRIFATEFISWTLIQHAVQQRFREILNTRFIEIVHIPRRRARSWGEEVAHVLEEN